MLFDKRYLPVFLFVLGLAVLASLTFFTPTEASAPAAPLAAYDCGYILGEVRMWTGSAAAVPEGWLMADGQAVSRSDYDELFGVIGTTYGVGDGSTTFNLPNLSGKFPLGVGGGHAQGASGGAETHTLTINEMPSHSHPLSRYQSSPAIQYGSNLGFPGYAGQVYGSTNAAGGGQAHNNMPPYVTLYYIIRVDNGHQQ